jgi:hypothetical protein
LARNSAPCAEHLAGQRAATLSGQTGSQGNLNPELCELASGQVAASCNSSSPASTCIFNDITIGTNAQPCASGRPNCTVVGSDTYGILTGFNATTGYNLATGLGSVNAANLVNSWDQADFSLSAAPASLSIASAGGNGTVVLTVTGTTGYTGTINFSSSRAPACQPSLLVPSLRPP